MAKRRRKQKGPDDRCLTHLGDARPEFVELLRGLKEDTSFDSPEHTAFARNVGPSQVMDAARRHRELTKITDGDLKLLSDALFTGSDKLKKSSIGLRQGVFIRRFMGALGAHVHDHAEDAYADQPQMQVADVREAVEGVIQVAQQEHDRLGFVPWENKAMAQCPDHELDLVMGGVESALTGRGIAFDFNWAGRALLDTLMLNPQVEVRGGKFAVHQAIKPPFVETLSKAIVGRVPGVVVEQRQEVAETLCQAGLYADNQGLEVGLVFPPLAEHDGVLGNTPFNCWDPKRDDIKPINPEIRKEVLAANRFLVDSILTAIGVVPGQSRFLEAGPGRGDFARLTPDEHLASFDYLEWNPHLIADFKKDFPDAKIKQGNAYNMRDIYGDSVFDGVFFFTASSSFPNLDHVVDQTWHALKPGGFLVSIHDLIANDQQVGDQLVMRGMFGMPHDVTGLGNTMWFRDPVQRDLAAEFFRDRPDPMTRQFWESGEMRMHQHAAKENISEYFYKWLELEVESRGFNFRSPPGCKTMVYTPPRSSRHKTKVMHLSGIPDGPFDFTAAGFNYDWDQDSRLTEFQARYGAKHAVEGSLLWVVLAQKPEH